MCDTYMMLRSTQTCPPPGQSTWLRRRVLDALAKCLLPSDQADQVATGRAAETLQQAEGVERVLVAGDEQDRRLGGAGVDQFHPVVARHRDGVEGLEGQGLVVDHALALAGKRRYQQAG